MKHIVSKCTFLFILLASGARSPLHPFTPDPNKPHFKISIPFDRSHSPARPNTYFPTHRLREYRPRLPGVHSNNNTNEPSITIDSQGKPLQFHFSPNNKTPFANAAPDFFSKTFGKHVSNDNTWIFNQHNLYQFEGFKNYAKTVSGYADYIHSLRSRLEEHKVRKSIRNIPGFGKRGFQHFIEEEDAKLYRKRVSELSNKIERQLAKDAKNFDADCPSPDKAEIELLHDLENTFVSALNETPQTQEMEHLCAMGYETLFAAYDYLEDGNFEQYQTECAFLEDISYVLKHPNEIQSQSFRPTASMVTTCNNLNLDVHSYFNNFNGNKVQLRLALDAFQSLEAAANEIAYGNLKYHNQILQHLAVPSSLGSAKAAESMNYQKSRILNSVCKSLVKLTETFKSTLKDYLRAYGSWIQEDFDAMQAGGPILVEGVKEGFFRSTESCVKLFETLGDAVFVHPKDSLMNLSKATNDVTIALGNAVLFSLINPGDAVEFAYNFAQKIEQHLHQIPIERLTSESIAFGTEMICTGLVGSMALNKTGQGISGISNLVKVLNAELQAAKSIAQNNPRLVRLLAPFSAAVSDVSHITKLAITKAEPVIKKGRQVVEKGRQVVGKGRGLIQKGAQEVGKALNTIQRNTRLRIQNLKEKLPRILKIQKKLDRFKLGDLFKNAEMIEGQLVSDLEDGTRFIYRRCIGPKAHKIRGYKQPVDHVVIEIQNPKKGAPGYKPFFKLHVVIDDNFNVIEASGNYKPDHLRLAKDIRITSN